MCKTIINAQFLQPLHKASEKKQWGGPFSRRTQRWFGGKSFRAARATRTPNSINPQTQAPQISVVFQIISGKNPRNLRVIKSRPRRMHSSITGAAGGLPLKFALQTHPQCFPGSWRSLETWLVALGFLGCAGGPGFLTRLLLRASQQTLVPSSL